MLFRAMMDVFRLSHPCEVTLGLFQDSPMLVDAASLHDSRSGRLSYKRFLRTNSMLNYVCDAWVRYRGFSHEVDDDGAIDSRSKVYVAL